MAKVFDTYFNSKELFYGNGAKFQESMKNMLSHVPLGRPAETEEIAHVTLFLVARRFLVRSKIILNFAKVLQSEIHKLRLSPYCHLPTLV